MSLQLVSVHDPVTTPSCIKLELFPTPVLAWRWAEGEKHKGEILDAIKRRLHRDRNGRSGWRSEPDLPAWPEPALQALTRWVAARVQETSLGWRDGVEAAPFGPWRMDGRAHVFPAGAFDAPHHHVRRNWQWSARYFVDLGDAAAPSAGGAVVFEERGTGLDLAGCTVRRSRRFVPAEGQLLIYPSWLHHRIESHRSGGDRVSIAFNLRNAALEGSRLWQHRPSWAWRTLPGPMRRLAAWRGTPDLGWNAVPPGVDILP